jgi:Ca2+-binding EF-hand superfamily protein
MRALFLEMDKDANNEISYQEFVSSIRGELSANKKSIIKIVFDVIDKDGDGIITTTDIGACFNPKNHPLVKSGRITVSNLTKDFFESLSNLTETGYLRFQQFMDFYANESAFEDDLVFSEMMKSVWLSGAKGVLEAAPIPSFSNNYGDSAMSRLISNASEKPTSSKPISNSLNYGASTVGNLMHVMTETDAGVFRNLTQVIYLSPLNFHFVYFADLHQLREQLVARGARGIVGLQRKFRIMDDDGTKTINLMEFKKAIRECGLKLTDLQLQQLFAYFDQDKNGTLNFDEFLQGVRVTTYISLRMFS